MGTTRQKSSCRNRLQNGPHSLLRMKVGTHSPLPTGSHTAAYTPKQGCFGRGWYHYPRTVSHVSETLRGHGAERRTLPLLGLGREVLSKNAESLRNSDALMRVAVPRRRGPAGPRDLFRFCQNCDFYALRLGLSARAKEGGGITTLGAFCVLSKHRTAACQKGSFAAF